LQKVRGLALLKARVTTGLQLLDMQVENILDATLGTSSRIHPGAGVGAKGRAVAAERPAMCRCLKSNAREGAEGHALLFGAGSGCE